MFLLELIFTIFTTIAAWDQYGPGWGDVDSLMFIDWSWEPLAQLNGISQFLPGSFAAVLISWYFNSFGHGSEFLRLENI